jgi:hypothetical protein
MSESTSGSGQKRWIKAGAIAAGAVAAEAAGLRRRGYGFAGGNVVVRCRDGHLFTTLWVPGASLKAMRLGWWRIQRCPVGHHWTVVTPVNRAGLSAEQAREAGAVKDIRIP